MLLSDGGRENHGEPIDAALTDAGMQQRVAQCDVAYSNSMIEAFWRSMKHNFLYTRRLDSLAAVERFVAFYVHQHNTAIPHAAFDGQTPQEVFDGVASDTGTTLATKRADARAARIAENQRTHCGTCPIITQPSRRAP